MVAALDVRLALRDLVRRDPRRREQLRQVRAGEVLERPRVGDLVHAAAHEQVAGQRPRRRVLDHLVDLQLVVARAGLEEEVVRQVLDQVAARRRRSRRSTGGPCESCGSAPWPPAMKWCGLRDALDGRRATLSARGRRRRRRAGQHRVDRRRDELDVAELLAGDVRDQVVERPRVLPAAEVERLERVVHERRHLAEPAAQQLLDGGGAGRIRVGRRRQLDVCEPVDAVDHGRAPVLGDARAYPAPGRGNGARRRPARSRPPGTAPRGARRRSSR